MRVALIGAGIIGLTCAYELAECGHSVEVFDADPAGGATHAAAGMLSPAGEAWFGEESQLQLGLASLVLWPGMARRLADRSGRDLGLRHEGTLLVGADRDDLVTILRTADFFAGHGIVARQLDRDDLLALESTLSTRIQGGALLAEEQSVNPRAVAAALIGMLGDRLIPVDARPDIVDGSCTGVVTSTGDRYPADVVVLATGHRLNELLPGSASIIRPVRGEIIRVSSDDPPARTIRAHVHGRPIYVVPRAGGEVVIGATSEEHAGDPTPTVGGVLRLLDDARTLLPTIERADILDITCRFRPGTPDNGPLIGPTVTPGLLVAGGHHRGGVLLAPITAVAICAFVDGRDPPEAARHFQPARFDHLRSTV